MEAIVLAGGFGTRLGELTRSCPKPLLPVNGRPFLEYVLFSCLQFPITSIVLAIGYLGEQIEQAIGSSFQGLPVRYVTDEGALGTGGVFRLAASNSRADQLLVMNGDTLARLDTESLIELHGARGADVTFSLKSITPRQGMRYDAIAVNEEGRIVENAAHNSDAMFGVNCGVTLIEREQVLPFFPDGVSRLEDILRTTENKIICYGCLNVSAFLDIGVPEDYAAAEEFVDGGI